MASVLLLVASTSSLTAFDTGVRDRLSNELGHSVTLRQNSQSVDTAGSDLLVISRSAGSGQPSGYADENIPVFSMSHFSYANFKWGTGSTAVGAFATGLRIIGDAHPLHAGVVSDDQQTVLTDEIDNWRGVVGPAAPVEAHWRYSGNTTPIVFSVPASSTLLDGRTNPQREAAFGFGGPDRFGELNATGLAIFDAAVAWTLNESELPPAVPVPSGFTFTATGLQLDGSWSAVTGADSYDWEIERDDAGSWVAFESGNTATLAFQVTTGVAYSTTYRARVRADDDGVKSDWSAYTSASTPADALAISATQIEAVALSWTANTGPYDIRRDETTLIAEGLTVTTFTDDDVTGGTSYTYEVREDGGAWSAPVTVAVVAGGGGVFFLKPNGGGWST